MGNNYTSTSGTSPFTTGGSSAPGTSGKNQSPFALKDTTNAQRISGEIRTLAGKYNKDLNTNRSLSKKVAGMGPIGDQ